MCREKGTAGGVGVGGKWRNGGQSIKKTPKREGELEGEVERRRRRREGGGWCVTGKGDGASER